MKTYKDKADREWRIELDYAEVRRVKAETGVYCLDLDQLRATAAQGDEAWHRLLFALVSPQAKKLSIDFDQWEASCTFVMAEITKLFQEELIYFFEATGQKVKAQTVRTLVAAHEKTEAELLAMMQTTEAVDALAEGNIKTLKRLINAS